MKKNQTISISPKVGERHFLFVERRIIPIVLLLILSLGGRAEEIKERITLNLRDVPLKTLLNAIQKQTSYSFLFNDEQTEKFKNVTVDVKNVGIKELLDDVFRETSLTYDIEEKLIFIHPKPTNSNHKVITLKGVVTDEYQKPLPGVTVLIKGTQLGSSTNVDGEFNFSISVSTPPILVFSFVGMESREIPFTGQTDLKVVLKESISTLEDVVVTGMFNRRKEGFTGSATTITGDELKRITTTNIAKALSTIDPSFRVMEDVIQGSNPNRVPDMRMRGQATLPGGNAGASSEMVTLQGEYETYPNQPLLILDGFEINVQTMVDLDPERIETITLLKDAAATAIYGSKAANGVIVIETKTPKEGKLWVSYSGNLRVEVPDLTDYNLMNAEEKLEAELRAGYYKNQGLSTQELYQSKLREVKRGVDTYWLDKPLRTSFQQRHALSLEGGDRALRYKLYVGYNHSPGVMKASQRRTLTGSLDLQYRFNKFIMRNSITVDDTQGDESPWGSFGEYTKLNPYLRPYGENGEILKRMDSFILSGGAERNVLNPMYNTTFNSKDRTTDLGLRNHFRVEYTPVESFRLEGSFALSKNVGKSDAFRPAQHTAFDAISDPELKGDYRRVQRESLKYSLDLTASYNHTFANIHNLTANVRMSLNENRRSNYGAYVTGFPNDNMDDLLFGRKYNEKMSGTENTSRLIGWVGTFGYSYAFKYSVDFNIRMDGSSQFGKDNRFAPFWSTGVRWDIKKENFIAKSALISALVVRSSYGVTGTQGFAPYQSQELYTYSGTLKPYPASDGTGASLVAMPNNKLKWQQTNTWNIALELGLWNNRITARGEYFEKITKNSLSNITLAPSLGFSSYPENMGEILNKGVELNVSLIPYRNNEHNAYWVVTLNGSHNISRLEKISDALKHMNEQNSLNVYDKPLPYYQEGESLSRIWVVESMGIDPATGNEIFRKRNGDMTGTWDVVDQVPYGDSEPQWQGNINSTFSYKGLGVTLNFNYRFGAQLYNSTLVEKVENADLVYNADKRVLDLRWQKMGDHARYKAIRSGEQGSQTQASSRFVMDDNNIRMGGLSLSYRMDSSNAPYLQRLGLTSANVAFNMEDLFYISSVLQERGLDYPFARQFAFSLNLTF